MLLGVIPIICFGIFRIFGEKSQKTKNLKSGQIGLLHHSVGNPRRDIDLRQGVGCRVATRLRCQNGTPRVCHGVAKLHHSVAVLRRIVATVHSDKFFNFISEHFVFVH